MFRNLRATFVELPPRHQCGSIPLPCLSYVGIVGIEQPTQYPRVLVRGIAAAFLDNPDCGDLPRFFISNVPSGLRRNRDSFGGHGSFQAVRCHQRQSDRSRCGTPYCWPEVSGSPPREGYWLRLPRDAEFPLDGQFRPVPEPSAADPDLWPPLRESQG